MAKQILNAARLRELLSYEPDTGLFRWRFSRKGRKGVAGSIAGSVAPKGYRYITIDRHRGAAHQFAWLYIYSQWPSFEIDHINGDRDDNRAINLRLATSSMNHENLRSAKSQNLSGGLLGVSRQTNNGDRRYRARIHVAGKEILLGRFDTAEAAHAAYLSAKRKLHLGCTI